MSDLLTAELSEKQTRSIKYQIAIAKLPTAKEIDEFAFDGTPINETLVRDLAEVLQGLFENGQSHGDVRPDRIVVTDGGKPRLLGIGFAWTLAWPDDRAAFMAKPDFLPPDPRHLQCVQDGTFASRNAGIDQDHPLLSYDVRVHHTALHHDDLDGSHLLIASPNGTCRALPSDRINPGFPVGFTNILRVLRNHIRFSRVKKFWQIHETHS